MTTVASADVHALAEALKASGKEADATTHEVLIRSANYLLTEMQVRAPVDTGALRKSLAVRVTGDRVIIGPDVPYASYVEFGTKPHVIKPKSKKVLAFKVDGQQVFARVVHHPGTKPNPFVQDSFDAWAKSVGPEIAEANVETIRKEFNKHAS
jgi:HK97 gp10 family phage protein